MRTLAVAAITGLIALAMAGMASAAPSVSMVWSATTGGGTTGGSSIDAVAGDTLTLQILVTPDANNVTYAGLSYDISAAGVASVVTQAGIGSINDDLANVFSTQNGNLVVTNATYTGGTLLFVGGGVTCPAGLGNLAPGLCGMSPFLTAAAAGTDIGGGIIGSFRTNPIGAPGVGATFTLAEAQFEVVPEPATGGLLALGLGALAFIGRRRA